MNKIKFSMKFFLFLFLLECYPNEAQFETVVYGFHGNPYDLDLTYQERSKHVFFKFSIEKSIFSEKLLVIWNDNIIIIIYY